MIMNPVVNRRFRNWGTTILATIYFVFILYVISISGDSLRVVGNSVRLGFEIGHPLRAALFELHINISKAALFAAVLNGCATVVLYQDEALHRAVRVYLVVIAFVALILIIIVI